jgi:hypothetical protein
MRKSILIVAMVLMSATAQAAPSRSLTLALNDGPAAAVQPKAVEPPNLPRHPKLPKRSRPKRRNLSNGPRWSIPRRPPTSRSPPMRPSRSRLKARRPQSRSTIATRARRASLANCIATAFTGKARKQRAPSNLVRERVFVLSEWELRDPRDDAYCETVCTTLLTGRALETGTLASLSIISSYSASVCAGALAFICTIL